ncbi:MAG TPA: hypothetical protein VGD33_04585 [Chitinophagaceae bacterium]
MIQVTQSDKTKFDNLRKQLIQTGNKESDFLKVEMIFFDALNYAREYGSDTDSNKLLLALKQLEEEEYHKTKAFFKKSSQREKLIQKFTHRLKHILGSVKINVNESIL